MSEPHLEDEASKSPPKYHDLHPQYNSYQPSSDRLTHIIENLYENRKLEERYALFQDDVRSWSKKPPGQNWSSSDRAGHFENGSLIMADAASIFKNKAILYRQRKVQDHELYGALSKLSKSEFDRIYASLERDGNRHMPQLVCGGRGLSEETFTESNTTSDAPVQPSRSFWKRTWEDLTRF